MSKPQRHSQGPYPHQTGNPGDMIRHQDGRPDHKPGNKDDGFPSAPNHKKAEPEPKLEKAEGEDEDE